MVAITKLALALFLGAAAPALCLPGGRARAPFVEPSNTEIVGENEQGDQQLANSGNNDGSSFVLKGGKLDGEVTVDQATQTCGKSQLSCCNEQEQTGDVTNGLLGSVLGNGDLIPVKCDPIQVIPLIGPPATCKGTAACCQGDTSQTGLVNVGCLALNSLLG